MSNDLELALNIEETDKHITMDKCLEDLFNKRRSTREKALLLLVNGFTKKLQHEFLANKSMTLLYQCLNSVKRGSNKEIYLASRLIGLLSITVGCKDDTAHGILEESFPQLSEVIKSGSEPMSISSLLNCLAIITLVGGNDLNETETSMCIMWDIFYPKSGSNMVSVKSSPAILTTAISTWSFLLTTMDGWKVSPKSWKESVSYFSDLLDHDDESVRIVAGEAISLIFEIGTLEKFCWETKGLIEEESVPDGNKCQKSYLNIEGLKEKILNQIRNLTMKADEQDLDLTKKKQGIEKSFFLDCLGFLEDGVRPKSSIKIGRNVLNISTWSQLLQANFMKSFLGAGYVKHMQENEFLHDVFEFQPRKKHISEDENHFSSKEVVHHFFQPSVRRVEKCSQRMLKSPNSTLSKARSQLLNKKRTSSQGKNAGHFAVGCEDGEEEVDLLV